VRTFQFAWESPANIEKGTVIIRAESISEAQDKFFAWLKTKPVYQHMWKLNLVAAEVEYFTPEVIE
jgi:hypothetical protein